MRLLELVGADGQGLLHEGGDAEHEDLVALEAALGEAHVPHGKGERDVDDGGDHPAGGGQRGPVHVLQVAQDDGDDGAEGGDCHEGERSVEHLRRVLQLSGPE